MNRWLFPLFLLTLAACDDESEATTKTPPPISGGTLIITGDGHHAIAADADRDRVWIVDVVGGKVTHDIVLREGDEPGRLADDADGRVHVALRRGGAVATIDIATGKILRRTEVCAAPRGVAYEAMLDAIHVACPSGELVTLRAGDGSELRRLELDRDLRDVVVQDGGLTLTRFRSAEILHLDTLGNVSTRSGLSATGPEVSRRFEAAVAWRMRPLPGGGVVIAHQRAMVDSVPLPPPGTTQQSTYGTAGGSSADPGIVHSVVSVVRPWDGEQPEPTDPPGAPLVPTSTLPVDVAVSSDGMQVALAAAGSGTVITFPVDAAEGTTAVQPSRVTPRGQPIAVAFDTSNRLWVQTRRPAAVQILGGPVFALGEEDKSATGADAAHELFHLTTGDLGSMACASCHPEGGDDGRVWSFLPHDTNQSVLRRTQTLRGGLTAGPYHWDGALADFDALVDDVMVGRMGAADPGAGRIGELADWLIAMPALPTSTRHDADTLERGRALFHASEVGCARCHSGAKLTNDETVDVGTGGPLQVPTLVGISYHAPFMHNGCAATLVERFGACGGGDAHGHTSQLSGREIADLVAYLETL
jgi:DNA-binding beta-propeller fold protein YncE